MTRKRTYSTVHIGKKSVWAYVDPCGSYSCCSWVSCGVSLAEGVFQMQIEWAPGQPTRRANTSLPLVEFHKPGGDSLN